MTSTDRTQSSRPPREVTGRTVLICLLAFFGLIAAMNAVLIRLAVSTFGGVETASSYQAGLAFKHDVAAAEQQDALHWQVDGVVTRTAAGEVILKVTVRDGSGLIIPGWTALARLAHPIDSRLDQTFAHGAPADSARGAAFADSGQWFVAIELQRDGERLFRSRSRVILR